MDAKAVVVDDDEPGGRACFDGALQWLKISGCVRLVRWIDWTDMETDIPCKSSSSCRRIQLGNVTHVLDLQFG